MLTEGVDYAWSRPDPAGLYAAGKRFASRYVSYDTTGKNLSLGEAEQLAAAGLSVVCNWEWRTGDARNGYDAGRQYAQEALRQATACGMPPGRPIYFSVDFDPAGQYASIDAYFRGIASVLPLDQIGAYGGYNTIDHLLGAGLIRWAWQTYAWSGGRWHPDAHVQQYRNGVVVAGGDVDLDRAMVAYFGQWTPGGDVTAQENWEYGIQSPGKPAGTLEEAQTFLAYANLYAFNAMNAALAALAGVNEILALLKQGGGQPPSGTVNLTPEAVEAVADATAEELANRLEA
jgi:hypothetical protein